jgi:hypothetical protein
MKRLELDFLRAPPAAPWAGWLLLAAGLALAADLGRAWHEARGAIALSEARLARAAPAARDARDAPPPAATPEQLEAARETIRRLSTPWGELFAALESTPAAGVALLGVTPDPAGASVLIAGEALDYAALVQYVAALRRAPPLARAYLIRHEARGARLAFAIRAPWGSRP